MSVLGILSTTQGLKLARLSGHRDQPRWEIGLDTIKFLDTENEGELLHELGKTVLAQLSQNPPEHLQLLKVVGSQHNHPAEIRVKVEGLLQMLGHRLQLSTSVVVPTALRNLEKKFDIFTGGSPEAVLNGGKKFKSVDLRTAVLTAWVGLPEADRPGT
ncbi:MAG: hypothetical protein U0931_05665 [Vulcanimicrobiota bacterium]